MARVKVSVWPRKVTSANPLPIRSGLLKSWISRPLFVTASSLSQPRMSGIATASPNVASAT